MIFTTISRTHHEDGGKKGWKWKLGPKCNNFNYKKLHKNFLYLPIQFKKGVKFSINPRLIVSYISDRIRNSKFLACSMWKATSNTASWKISIFNNLFYYITYPPWWHKNSHITSTICEWNDYDYDYKSSSVNPHILGWYSEIFGVLGLDFERVWIL